MSYTIDQLVGRVSEALCNESSPDAALKSRIKMALHASLLAVMEKVNLFAFREESMIPVAEGQCDYPLESDVHKINAQSFYYQKSDETSSDGYPMEYVDHEQMVRLGSTITTTTDRRPRYFSLLKRDKVDGLLWIRLATSPSESCVIRYGYYAKPLPLNTLADGAEIDKRIDDSLAHAIVFRAIMDFPEMLSQAQISVISSAYSERMLELGKQSDPVVGNIKHVRGPGMNGPMMGHYGISPIQFSTSAYPY